MELVKPITTSKYLKREKPQTIISHGMGDMEKHPAPQDDNSSIDIDVHLWDSNQKFD